MKSLLVFVLGALLFGGIVIGIAYQIGSEGSGLQAGVAFALAFVPAAVTLGWITYSFRSTPDMKLLASLGASGFRMAIALGGGYFLTDSQPDRFDSLWYWLILFYLVLLAFEITILVRQQPNLNGSPPTA